MSRDLTDADYLVIASVIRDIHERRAAGQSPADTTNGSGATPSPEPSASPIDTHQAAANDLKGVPSWHG